MLVIEEALRMVEMDSRNTGAGGVAVGGGIPWTYTSQTIKILQKCL